MPIEPLEQWQVKTASSFEVAGSSMLRSKHRDLVLVMVQIVTESLC